MGTKGANRNPPEFCTIAECDRPHKSKGYCLKHYARLYRTGDPHMVRPRPSGPEHHKWKDPVTAFWEKVDKSGDCWIWTGAQTQGYGAFKHHRRVERRYMGLAHRYSYWLHTGRSPKGFDVHHICKNTLCVNPCHLVAVVRGSHRLIEANDDYGTLVEYAEVAG